MSERWLLSFLKHGQRYNYRTAGVIIRNGHVLVCREDTDDFVYLPGGRVEFGEPSNVALAREIEEELHCTGKVGRLLFSVENFFDLKEITFHEISKYYLVDLPGDFPYILDGPTLTTFDEGHELNFYWVPISHKALTDINLLPKWLRGRLSNLPTQTEHLIEDER